MTPRQQQQRGRWLIAAIGNDRERRAEELVREGADLSVRTAEGETALYAALAYGHYSLVNLILEHGADPNAPGPYGSYPLHLAAEWGGEDAPTLLEALLRHGARVDARDEDGATPVFLAGKVASEEAIRVLLRYGADINDRNRELDTALTFASCWGMTDRGEMLLDLEIDVNARDDAGMTALAWAARGGHADTVALLVRRGAEVNVADQWGRTPLLRAADHGSARCVGLLLEAGADPREQDTSGRTALDHARRFAGCDLAEELVALLTDGARRQPAEETFVEREVTPGGEMTIRVGVRCGSSARILEKCDGFAAVVGLLEDALAQDRAEIVRRLSR